MEENTLDRLIKVLVIEDDPFTAMVYEDQLADVPNLKFELDVYETMAEGREAYEANSYDILLLDLNLPDSEQAKTVERIPEFSDHLPVIIMTSTNSELIALKTVNLGSQDFLVKSDMNKVLLVRSILYAIERQQLKTDLKAAMREAERERDRSERLLLNILPSEVASELKDEGVYKAREFDDVTVLFTDFQGFTGLSERMTAADLVKEIDTCFRAFDEIVSRHGLEKIKTIGDAYMAAGGLHNPRTSEPEDVVLCALEMQRFMRNRAAQLKEDGEPCFQMRVGVHTGPVIAGIVGSMKFQYDIWGDTVNTASRMEHAGEVGKVNLSSSTHKRIMGDPRFRFESRGVLPVKGKEDMEMWFAEEKVPVIE